IRRETVAPNSSSAAPIPHQGEQPLDKLKSLDLAISQLEKAFGKGTVMRLGSRENLGIDIIPTGSIALDLALGVGGIPRGRIVEIYGQESSGKTTLAYHVVAEAQRQ